MSFSLISISVQKDILFTRIAYDINGVIDTISVPHFRPATKIEVVNNIKKALVNEKSIIDATTNIATIKPSLDADIAKKIIVQ